MSKVEVTNHYGVGWVSLLGVILVLAKIFGYTDISWWWCLAPFWIPWAILLSICLIPLIALGIAFGVAFIADAVKVYRAKRGRRAP